MNREQFEALDDQLMSRADDILKQRRGAYASDTDVLTNFKQLAAESGLTIAMVWEVLFRKSLNALCRVVANGQVAGEPNIDRCSDAINYVRLGFAIANDGKEPTPTPAVQSKSLSKLLSDFQTEQEHVMLWQNDPRWRTLRQGAANRYVD